MKTSSDITKIAAALVAVQKRIDPIAKDATNPHFKSRYSSLDTITEYLRPILAEEGCVIVQGGGENENGVAVETMILHESGQWISSELPIPLEKGTAQSAGSAISYGRRYGLSAILALSGEDDDDANHATATSINAQQLRQATTARGGSAPPATEAMVDCPKCGGATWDNRLTKKNPKQPDYKCRDAKCGGVIWPPKESSNGKSAVAAGPGMDPEMAFDHEDGYR